MFVLCVVIQTEYPPAVGENLCCEHFGWIPQYSTDYSVSSSASPDQFPWTLNSSH